MLITSAQRGEDNSYFEKRVEGGRMLVILELATGHGY